MLAKLFEFVTKGEIEDRLRELGLKYESLMGVRLCLLDEELNKSGVCFYIDERGNVYKVVVETDYIGNKEKFKQFLRDIRQKYGLGRDVNVEVRVRDFVWYDDVKDKLTKPVIRKLGGVCTFDDELNAEICFGLGRRYGRTVVRRVLARTTFLGGKEKFKKFLERLREKYGLPRTIDVDVVTVSEENLKETRWWYEHG